jgi:hypothetical protein
LCGGFDVDWFFDDALCPGFVSHLNLLGVAADVFYQQAVGEVIHSTGNCLEVCRRNDELTQPERIIPRAGRRSYCSVSVENLKSQRQVSSFFEKKEAKKLFSIWTRQTATLGPMR